MQVLTRAETLKWLRANEIELHGQYGPRTSDLKVSFSLPRDTAKRVALVLKHMEMFRISNRFAVVLTDWSVGLTPERMQEFLGFRLAHGESRWLIDAPGHLFARPELDSAKELVALAARFEWDCHAVTRQRKRQMFISHDEFGLASHAP